MKLLQNIFKTFHPLYKMSFYAVAKGHTVGIYDTWFQCEKQVKNFKGAKYKKFPTRQQAELFIKGVNEVNHNDLKDTAVALCQQQKKAPMVDDFWPECDGDELIENDITDAELLSALYEVEGLPTTSSLLNTGQKRKASDKAGSMRSKQLKHASKEWLPAGLKKIGDYEFQIDSEGSVIVYTDGSCINNGQVGAVAGLGVYFGDNHPLNAAKPVRGRVTNNAGEIQAAIHAIQVARDLNIPKLCISTDSQFLINSITSWMKAWKLKGWRLKNGDPVKNVDDFKILDKLLSDEVLAVKWNYVKAHKGIKGNEMADKLAKEGSELYKLMNN